MAEKLEIVITADDQASKVVTGLSGVIRNAFSVALGIGIAKLVEFGASVVKSLIDEPMEAEVNLKKLNAIIKSTGGVAGVTSKMALDLADSLMKVTRFSDDAVLESEKMLLTFTQIGKEIFPDATEATLNMAEMFRTDATQAAIQLGKALNDPVNGVTALRRVGVRLTDEQEEQIKQFMAVNDVASAQRIILDELNTEFGGLARAAGDTLAGKLTILKNRFLNAAEAAGMSLLPKVEKLVDVFSSRAAPVVEKLADKFSLLVATSTMLWNSLTEGRSRVVKASYALERLLGINPEKAFKLANYLYDVRDAAKGVINNISRVIEYIDLFGVRSSNTYWILQQVFGDWLGDRIFRLLFGLQDVIDTFKRLYALNVTPFLDKINTLVTIIQSLGIHSVAVRWALNDIFGKDLTDKIFKLVDAFGGLADRLKTALEDEGLKGAGQVLLDTIASGFPKFLDWIHDKIIIPLANDLVNADWSPLSSAGGAGEHIMTAIGSGITDVAGWITTYIALPLAKFALETDWDVLKIVGPPLMQGIAHGITDLGSWVLDHVLSPIAASASAVASNPETWKLLEYVGGYILDAIAAGALDLGSWVVDHVLSPLAANIKDAASNPDNWKDLGGILGQILAAIGAGVLNFGSWVVVKVINPVASSIKEAADNPDNWKDLGEVLGKLLAAIIKTDLDLGAWVYEHIVSPLADKVVELAEDPRAAEKLVDFIPKLLVGAIIGPEIIAAWVLEHVIVPFINGLLLGIVGEDNYNKIKTFATLVWNGIQDGLGDIGSWINDNLVKPIGDWIEGAGKTNILNYAKELGKGIQDGIIDGLKGLKSAIAQAINDAIPDSIDLGITTIDLPDNPLQLGGIAEPGQAYKVNELGGEGFMPLRRGIVIPHDIFRKLERSASPVGGGGGNTFILNVNSNAESEQVIADFLMMQTFMGAG